ncbi:hypothetical protein [Streptomyces sp. NPDC048603]|uniref:hypothetical protein n=1 Tax=Streptomyces sp. NPDC048603 TaxID=3365577 RepID=UPI0037206DFB
MRAGGAGVGVLAAVLAWGAAAPAVAPAVAADGLITVIDNSHADSVVEVDRSANLQVGSGGAAGSDQEGSAVDVLATLVEGGSGGARRA